MSAYDEDAVAREQERMEMRDTEARQDLEKVLATPEGRRVLWSIIAGCNIFHAITQTNAQMYLYQGAKNVGLKLIDQIESVDDNAFLEMMREGKQRAREDAAFIARIHEQSEADS